MHSSGDLFPAIRCGVDENFIQSRCLIGNNGRDLCGHIGNACARVAIARRLIGITRIVCPAKLIGDYGRVRTQMGCCFAHDIDCIIGCRRDNRGQSPRIEAMGVRLFFIADEAEKTGSQPGRQGCQDGILSGVRAAPACRTHGDDGA